MKIFFRGVLAVILAAAAIWAGYYTAGGRASDADGDAVLTTVSRVAATERYANKRLLAADKANGIELYVTDDKVLVYHGKKEFEYNLFTSYMELEKPTMYCEDLDADGKRDIVVRCVSGQEQGTGDFVYDLFILHREDKKGEESYSLITATQSEWHDILDSSLIEEISQLKTCKKCVQFAMTVRGMKISYDKETGIATKNAGYTGFFRALQDSKGRYMTVDRWNKGKGSYYVDKNGKLCCEVEVVVNYKEDTTVSQKAGTVYFELSLNEKNRLSITSGSMIFTPSEQYRIANPKKTADKAWKTELKNSAKPAGSEAINWLQYSLTVDSKSLTETKDLSAENTDIVFVDTVTVSEKEVTMTAKDGYTFDAATVNKGEFSLTINKGTKNAYEISYTASLGNDNKTLTIQFDKTYNQDDIQTLDISFGAK